jgi:hypothetical protein
MTTYLRNMNNQNDDNRSFDLAKRDIYSQKKKREQLARLLSAANGIKPSMFNPLSNVKIKISPKELPQDSAIVRRNVNELATDQRTIYRTSNRRFDGMIPARNVKVELEEEQVQPDERMLEIQRQIQQVRQRQQMLKDNVFGEKYNPDKLEQRYESHSQKGSARQVERNFGEKARETLQRIQDEVRQDPTVLERRAQAPIRQRPGRRPGTKLSEETKQRMRESRKEYLNKKREEELGIGTSEQFNPEKRSSLMYHHTSSVQITPKEENNYT